MKKYDLYKFDTMTVEEFRADSNNIMANGDSESGNAIANSALSKRGCQYVWGAKLRILWRWYMKIMIKISS